MSQTGRPPSAMDSVRSTPDNSTVKAISDFQAVASKVDDASSIYRVLRPFWASNSMAHLVEPAEKVLSLVPSSRSAVLNYLGMLVHEATHLYFSKKENPYFGTDNSNVERAVRKLARDLEQLISSTDQRSFSLQVLAYLCSLFIELCTCNYERPIAKQAGIGPRSLLLLFQSSPSISSLLRLFDRAAANLLECAPDDCFNILLDASRHGFYFDWMWLHIASSFPAPVISFLLKTGAEEFKQYALTIASHEQQGNQAAAFETHQVYNQKFMPLAETFMYLASKRNAELSSVTREMLIKGIELLDGANEPTLGTATDLSLPFLFKIVTSSPDVLRFLAQHANELVKSSVVLKVCMQMSQISKHCILPVIPGVNHTYTAFLERFLCFLSVDAIASLLDMALPIAFDEHVFDQVSPHNKQFCDGMKDGAIELVNAIISTIISSVHRQPLFVKAENGTLGRCIFDTRKLNEYILGAMSGGERGKFSIRLLYAFCILAGPIKTSEVIVRFILDAEDKPQLNALCALLIALAPIMPSVAEDAIKDFVSLKNIIESERKKKSAGSQLSKGLMSETTGAYNAANVTWIKNLHTLNIWQKSAPEDHPFKYIRFEMTRQYGQLMGYLLTWTRDELDRIECDTTIKNASEKEELRTNIMLAVIGFSTSIGPPAVLKPRYAHKLCAQFASLLISLLKSTGDAEQPSAFSLFLNACGPVVQFLESQPVYVRGQFATHFLDEALSRTRELFGGSYEKQIRFDGGCMELGTIQNALKEVSIMDNCDESLFERARKIPIEQRKPFDMANCGIIGKGVRKLQKITIQEGECFHQMLFIECATRFAGSTNADDKFFPIPSVYRQLAETITQRVCKDGLVSTFTWNEWEVEREAAHKYIAVAKTVSDIPFVWSLLSVISEVHPCLWYCIPLLKAILASVMIHFENNSDQKSHPSESLLDTLDRWFFITRKGKVLPIQMVVFFDIISKVTYREGFVILLDMWRYFQSIVHPLMITTFNDAIERSSDIVVVDPIKGDVGRFIDSCRLVIQRNIARLGAFFPLLLVEESPEADNDFWKDTSRPSLSPSRMVSS